MNESKYSQLTPEEKEELWDKVADWFSIPEDERSPKTQTKMYNSLGIPERTWFDNTAKASFLEKVTTKALSKAKKRLPEVLRSMQKKAEEGSEKSVEMFLKYIAQLSEKTELRMKGEIKHEALTNEEYSKLRQEIISSSNQKGSGE